LRLEPLEDRLTLSDGTGAGTALVKDFIPGTASSSIYFMGDLNGTLLLSVYDGGSGYQGVELWRSNGTAAGATIVAGVEALSPFTVIGNSAFFAGEDATTPDFELFKTDGTTTGTVWVNRTGDMSHPRDLTDVNGTLFFSAADPAHGFELWKSDGTPAGTVLVKDINPGSGWSNPANLTNVNGTLFFTASDGTSGTQLWKSDGTAAGTVLIKDINPNSSPADIHATPHDLTNVNGTLFLAADDAKSGEELWKSDGTSKGTVMVKDIYSGSTTISGHGDYGHSHDQFPNSSSPSGLVNVNGTLYFSAYDGKTGRELWKSDGTSKGTVLVKDIYSGTTSFNGLSLTNSSDPAGLINLNGTLFFTAVDGVHGRELWTSAGTAAGTILVKDINPGGAGSNASNLTNANGSLYFAANDGTHGTELWKSNGTAAGTVLVADINPGAADSVPAYLTVSGGHLFFSADDGVHGTELWDPLVPSTLTVLNNHDAGAGSLRVAIGRAKDGGGPLLLDCNCKHSTSIPSRTSRMSSVARRPIPRISSMNFFPTFGSPRTRQHGAGPRLEPVPRSSQDLSSWSVGRIRDRLS
jgi:ELWxxDGT repeat protein